MVSTCLIGGHHGSRFRSRPQDDLARRLRPAVGLGATIALLCDVIFAAEDAVIADPHVRAGIVASDGGAVIWPQSL